MTHKSNVGGAQLNDVDVLTLVEVPKIYFFLFIGTGEMESKMLHSGDFCRLSL